MRPAVSANFLRSKSLNSLSKIKCWLWFQEYTENVHRQAEARGSADRVTSQKPEWGDGIRAGY